MKKRVADLIMEILVSQGITDCFAVVGGGAMHLDNALALTPHINKYFNHHEQACAMAAEAYARYSGKMAAVCVTSGPGATNAITGVMGAWQDSLPMLVLSGQVRYEISVPKSGLPLRYRGTQEFDIIHSVQNMTKYAAMVTDPLAIKRELIKAIRIAYNGRRGPVWLDIPLDIQSQRIEETDLYPCDFEPNSLSPLKDEIAILIKYLNKSKRPCILAGSGIISGHAQEEFEHFVNMLKIPVIGGAWVSDVFYTNHPLFFGLSGNIGPRTGNFILQNSDLIISLGNSLGYRQTGFDQKGFAPNAKIIMVDADENESRKPGLHVDYHILSEVQTFCSTFIYSYTQMENHYIADAKWMEYCNHLKNRFSPYEAAENIVLEDRVCSYYFWKKFDAFAPDDTIVCLGNNTACSSKLQIGKQHKNQRVITNYACGSMGYDLPASIGACIASGKKDVFCITGDGSIMMNLQELQTIKYLDLPIKIIIFSNDGYNAIRQTCKNFFNNIKIGCNAESGIDFPDFSKVAKAFGFSYQCCQSNKELDTALEWFFSIRDQALLEIRQLLDDPVIPKVMSRLLEDGTFSTPTLEDMYPFLDKEEYEKLMLW